MTRTWAVNDKAKLFDYSGRHGDIGKVDYIGNGVVLLDLGDCIWPVDPSDLKPVATFEEMCKERDPLYAAMQPSGEWRFVFMHGTEAQRKDRDEGWKSVQLFLRDYYLLRLAVRALRNQGRPLL